VAEGKQLPEQREVELSDVSKRSQDSFEPAPPIPVSEPVSMTLDPGPVSQANDSTPQPTPPTDYDG
jgi:hypothetical protein